MVNYTVQQQDVFRSDDVNSVNSEVPIGKL